uniref:Col_cuticle_N domain-containing protein n=1 Tax=Parastrongyloides trichosuri TaxID=131310 RepID=A0A0N4ZNP9_PARTI
MSIKFVSGAACAIGAFSLAICFFSVPIIYNDIQLLRTELEDEMSFFRTQSNDLWKEMVNLGGKRNRRQANYYAPPTPTAYSGSGSSRPGNFPGPHGPGGINPSGGSTDFGNVPTLPNGQPGATPQIVGVPPAFNNGGAPSVNPSGNSQCQCSNIENKCPAGPPGPKGEPGLDGEAGAPGNDGKDGDDAEDVQAQHQQYGACFNCPAGPQGPAGPSGRPGARGMRGARGQPGMPGRDGQPGMPGSMGPTGAVGPAGEAGAEGTPGDDVERQVGRKGPRGERGSVGPIGEEGDKGAVGEPGMMGPQGERGPQGPPGKNGEDGAPGEPGEEGEPGQDAEYCSCPQRSGSAASENNYAGNEAPARQSGYRRRQ